MPDTQFIAVILLLVAVVIAAYFYLKRAQARDANRKATPADDPDTTAPGTRHDSIDQQ